MTQLEPSPLHPALARGAEIERRAGLTAAAFMAEYALPNKPVILTDALAGWKAIGRWTPDFFQQQYGELVLSFQFGERKLPMKEFIPLVMQSSAETPAPYWTNARVRDYFPELLDDIQPLPPMLQPNWAERAFLHGPTRDKLNGGANVEIYVGGPGGRFPVLHWDVLATHAFLMQVYGVKQYWVWPPSDDAYMYPLADGPNRSPIKDVDNPDFVAYPLFARAHATTFVLNPGEMLFVPSRWWHTARILSPSITLSVNTLNRSNWANFSQAVRSGATGVARTARGAYLAVERVRNWAADLKRPSAGA